MKRRPEPRTLISRLAVAGLLAVMLLSAACGNGDTNNSSSSAPSPDIRPANARADGTATPDKQANATVVNAGQQSGANAGETNAAGPSIQITEVPPKGAGPDAVERIAGKVSGVNVKECKVVIFAHTDKWYVQPYIDSADTKIGDDGVWESDTHLGSEYAALLVRASYKPPTTTGTLPNVAGPVLAIARAAARK